MLTSARLFLMLMVLAGLAWAQPRDLAIYPFASQDVVLGVAFADRIGAAFSEIEVYGPELTPSLVAPISVSGGFINPLAFLTNFSNNSNQALASRTGVMMMHDMLGIDAVLTGNLRFVDNYLELELFLASSRGVHQLYAEAPEDQPQLLVRRAVSALASSLRVTPHAVADFDLMGDYGDYARALTLVSGGFLADARAILATVVDSDLAEDSWQALLDDIEALEQNEAGADPARIAVLALNQEDFNLAQAIRYFEDWAAISELPLVDLWLASLNANAAQEELALTAFAEAGYAYGRIAEVAYRLSLGQDIPLLEAFLDIDSAAIQLATALAAQDINEQQVEKTALQNLSHLAPTMTYPFERLSFIAFDEDDALAAAQALSVAVELAPESDLYWTNLGWAYYLLDFVERSEAASVKALELSEAQFIAWYNLGLARVVSNRLDEAMEAYEQALRRDPEVDDEAIIDLENALDRYPQAIAVHFALATLYEREGRKDDAIRQFEAYVRKGGDANYLRQASQRLESLKAPPPAIEISSDVSLGLGLGRLEAAPYHPGDRLYPAFELFTPGFELPTRVTVRLSLAGTESSVEQTESSVEQEVQVGQNIVAFNIDRVGLDLPTDLPPGSYDLDILVTADEGREARFSLPFEVSGEAGLMRQLIGRNIVMRALDSGEPLYGQQDLDDDGALLAALSSELKATAQVAEDVLPIAASGRFEGLSGGAIFNQSTSDDIRDFLSFILSESGTSDVDVGFVDAYAQWALEQAQ